MKSVRARLALLFAALTGSLLAAFAVGMAIYSEKVASSELERRLDAEIHRFRAYFIEEWTEVKAGVHPSLAAELLPFTPPGATAIHVTGPDGALIAASTDFAPPSETDEFEVAVGGEPFHGRRFVIEPGAGERFQVALAINGAFFARHRAWMWIGAAASAPLALALSWLLGLYFVRRALAPIEQMRREAERISVEGLTGSIPEPRTTGEFLELCRTFNRLLDALRQSMENLEHFAADAAHELRTPLTNLKAELELELSTSKGRTPEENERLLVSLHEEVTRMHRTVTDLFTLARMKRGEYTLVRERIRIGGLLEEAQEIWEPVAATHRVSIERKPGDAEVHGDPTALRRVFMNLIENAVKYNRDGGAVRLSVEKDNGHVLVRVADTGPGIPAHEIHHLFKRFHRIDRARSRDTGGAGLGLAICKSFVEAHGGNIRVESEPGKETSFVVELPAPESPAP